MKYISRIILSSVVLLFLFVQTGCRQDDSPYDGLPLRSNTFFIYMAANNSLGDYRIDDNNLNQLVEAFRAQYYGSDSRIIVYRAPKPRNGSQSIPTLLEIKGGIMGGLSGSTYWNARIDTLKVYAPQSAAEGETLRMAIDDMKSFAPADEYGLVLWSHATGWLPASETAYTGSSRLFDAVSGMPLTRAFGQEGSQWMELSTLAEALPDRGFDYIIFDACYMGQVEVAYALRNKATYMIASPAEVPFYGLPYTKIVKHVFAVPTQLAAISRDYYEHYNDQSQSTPYATTALYDLRQMEPLAGVMSRIVAAYGSAIEGMNISGIQRYDRFPTHTIFDLEDFVATLVPASDGLRNELTQQLQQTILYKAHTPTAYGIPINTYCGMSTYIPVALFAGLTERSYVHTDWYQRVYAN